MEDEKISSQKRPLPSEEDGSLTRPQRKKKGLLDETKTLLDDDQTDQQSIVNEEPEEGDEEFSDGKDAYTRHLDFQFTENMANSWPSTPRVDEVQEWPQLGRLIYSHKKLPQLKEDLIEKPKIQDMSRLMTEFRSSLVNNLKAAKRLFKCDLHRELLSLMTSYKDILYTEKGLKDANNVRLTYCLHALNHVLKTKNNVVNHNQKMRKHSIDPTTTDEFRDQGLARPQVLILVPFKESCLRIVQMLVSLVFGRKEKVNVANMKKFIEEFSPEDDDEIPDSKPGDFKEIFAGNISDTFRIGIAATKKSLKLYSNFYKSDILITSPLGLRMIIGAEGDEKREYDFLASIQMLIIDQAEVLLMQNWDHLLLILKHLNLLPKRSHDVNFSRIRLWELEGWAKHFRQMLVFSRIQSLEIESLFARYAFNYEGQVIIHNPMPTSKAAVSSVYIKSPQIFRRFQSQSLVKSVDDRFEYFVKEVLPQLLDPLMKQTLIFVPSYFDYVRLRNHFHKEEINYVQICEYTSEKKVAKARGLFFNGSRQLLLFTERYHFYNRHKIKGIRHLVFYQLPHFPRFYTELCNYMHPSNQGHTFKGDESSFSCTILYDKFDRLALAAVVGSDRAEAMLSSSNPVHVIATQ